MTTGMHDAWRYRCIRKPRPFGYGDCVHVRADEHSRAGLDSGEICDHACPTDARSDREAKRLQPFADDRGGSPLREGELGMSMQIAPELDEIRLQAIEAMGRKGHGHCRIPGKMVQSPR
jgi:hypothetical protein